MENINIDIVIVVAFILLVFIFVIWALWTALLGLNSYCNRKDAYRRLNNGFNNDSSYSEIDVRICFEYYNDIFHSYFSFLDGYLAQLDNKAIPNKGVFKKAKDTIIKLREKALEKEPFAELEGDERILMDEIYDAVSTDPDTKRIAKDKLDYLSRSIVKTNKELKKAQKNNKYTIPLAIISFIFTIISLFSRVKLSKTEFDQMKNTVKESIAEQLNSNDEATINLEDVNNEEEQ